MQVHFPVSHCAHKSDCVKTVPFSRYRNRDFSHSPKAKKEASQLDSVFGLLTGSLVPVTESSRGTKMSFYTLVSKLSPRRECQQKPVEFGHSQITLLGAIGYRNHYALIILVLGQTRSRTNLSPLKKNQETFEKEESAKLSGH